MTRTKEEFMASFRGIRVSLLTRALNRLTPGIVWTGCPKNHLAERWVEADTRTRMDGVELARVHQLIKEIE